MFARHYNKYLVASLLLLIIIGAPQAGFTDSVITSPSSCPAAFSATAGTAFSYTFTGTGGRTTNPWRETGLPGWLTLNSTTGVLSGTPTNSGVSNFTITLRAASGTSATCAITMTVSPIITTPSSCPYALATGVVGDNYYYDFQGTGGRNNPWQVSSGTLPAGFTLGAASGNLYDYPVVATPGQYTFTVRYRGNNGTYDECPCTLVIQPALTTLTISGTGALNFGTISADTVPATATATPPSIICTNGSSIYLTADNGLYASGSNPRMTDGSGHYIVYSYTFSTPLTCTGLNIGSSLNFVGTIAAGALNTLPAGTYTDTITLTFAY